MPTAKANLKALRKTLGKAAVGGLLATLEEPYALLELLNTKRLPDGSYRMFTPNVNYKEFLVTDFRFDEVTGVTELLAAVYLT